MRSAGDIPQTDHVGLGNSFLELNLKEVCWLAGRHRQQAGSHRKAKAKAKAKAAYTRRSSPLNRPSVSSPAALDLDPPAPSEG
jgi:hypothetical protein